MQFNLQIDYITLLKNFVYHIWQILHCWVSVKGVVSTPENCVQIRDIDRIGDRDVWLSRARARAHLERVAELDGLLVVHEGVGVDSEIGISCNFFKSFYTKKSQASRVAVIPGSRVPVQACFALLVVGTVGCDNSEFKINFFVHENILPMSPIIPKARSKSPMKIATPSVLALSLQRAILE